MHFSFTVSVVRSVSKVQKRWCLYKNSFEIRSGSSPLGEKKKMEIAWKSNCNSPLGMSQKHISILYIVLSSFRGGGVLFRTAHFPSGCYLMHEDLSFQWHLTVLQLQELSQSCLLPKPACNDTVSVSVLTWVTKWAHLSRDQVVGCVEAIYSWCILGFSQGKWTHCPRNAVFYINHPEVYTG